ncbi:MAG TPA: redoxin domain-containing protein [Fimbriimonadaceae bacterium]|nr:redoxin domain-containing protein [Fimbriimonadaceae bacterium]
MRPFLCTVFVAAVALSAPADDGKFGHSKHGTAFDAGLRSRPWKIEGAGHAPFRITTQHPEVQGWFDQANALLHSFWFEEAERSLRWCHKLEPDNAMVYWGLARCGLNWFTMSQPGAENLKRYRDFLVEAVKRKDGLPERERMYIEAWEAACLQPGVKPTEVIVQKLSAVCMKYPDDIEAKALLGLFNIRQGSPVANDALLQDVLRVAPMHPGAHHARIHNWDGLGSEQAIASCELYGKAAPGVGHSLHMPGHIYAKVGMWHEAALAMDSATRVELSYMNNRLALPYETWNYAHNRDYLCYIQEQLGRGNDSIRGAKDLIAAPQDPEVNPADTEWTQFPLMRALVKFERWGEILDGKTLRPMQGPEMNAMRTAAEVIALLETGKRPEARERNRLLESQLAGLREQGSKDDKAGADERLPLLIKVAQAKVRIADGDRLGGLAVLMSAAEQERKARERGEYANDPPFDPWPVLRIVADVFAEGGDHRAAIDAYEKALAQEPNDGWCLAGLAQSWIALGDRAKAREYAGRLMAVWSGADKGLRPMEKVLALKLNPQPFPKTLRPERTYEPSALDKLGPSNWKPFAAPKLVGVGVDGKPVTLEDYRGKNVLLVFYLSDKCVHCVEQLSAIHDKWSEFDAENTVVLACSSDTPEKNNANDLSSFKIKLISDKDHENARRFASYDDFESMELHSTILIDKEGRVRWKRTGGDPFMKIDYLLAEIKRWEKR